MCKLCETEPVYEFTNKRKVCKNCFVRYFQKKFLTTVRKFEMIKKEDFVGYRKGNGFRDAVLEDLLLMFARKGTIELVKLASPPKLATSSAYDTMQINANEIARPPQKFNKIAVASTIDSESDKLVHILFKGNANDLKELKPVDKKIIKPLYLFLDEEVMLYATIKKLKFKKTKEVKDNLSRFVDRLETKHPEIKRAIVNSYLELR